MIDQEQLLIELYERGIDTDITLSQAKFVVQLDDLKTKRPLGVAKSDSIEGAIAQIMKNLAEDSKAYKAATFRPDSLSIH